MLFQNTSMRKFMKQANLNFTLHSKIYRLRQTKKVSPVTQFRDDPKKVIRYILF